MSAKTTIERTDRTWNPVRGCSLVSAGCTNCYAVRQAHRFSGPGKPFEGLTRLGGSGPTWTGKIKLVEDALLEPLKWRKPCRVFVNSMSDLFHEGVPDAFIDRLLTMIALTPHLTYQVLTKRPERMEKYITRCEWNLHPNGALAQWITKVTDSPCAVGYVEDAVWPLPNLHLGVSVEDQAAADQRIPPLLRTPAAVRFISAEPLLGVVDLHQIDGKHATAYRLVHGEPRRIDWVICGGESGRGARPMHPEWARGLRDQCAAAGVPFFFKQWGEYVLRGEPYAKEEPARRYIQMGNDEFARIGKKRAGRLLDGVEHNGRPHDEH